MEKYIKIETLASIVEQLKIEAVNGYVNINSLDEMIFSKGNIISFRINDIDEHIKTLIELISSNRPSFYCSMCNLDTGYLDESNAERCAYSNCRRIYEGKVMLKAEFSTMLGISRPTMNKWITNMEEMGYITKCRNFYRYSLIDPFAVLEFLKNIKMMEDKGLIEK